MHLQAGQLMAAWREYPSVLRGIAESQSGSRQSILVTGPMRSGTTWVAVCFRVRGSGISTSLLTPIKGCFTWITCINVPDLFAKLLTGMLSASRVCALTSLLIRTRVVCRGIIR